MLQVQISNTNQQKLPINVTSLLTFSIFLDLQDTPNANNRAVSYTPNPFKCIVGLWDEFKRQNENSNILNYETETCTPITFFPYLQIDTKKFGQRHAILGTREKSSECPKSHDVGQEILWHRLECRIINLHCEFNRFLAWETVFKCSMQCLPCSTLGSWFH